MSKEFGLDWKKYDYERMSDFMLIAQIEANMLRQQNSNSQSNASSQGKVNIRNRGKGK